MAGASRIAGITINIGGETTELQKSLKDVNKSLKDTYSQLRDVNKLLKLDPKNTELLRQKQELLSKAIADTKTKLDKEKQALEQLKNADGAEKTKQQQEALTREIIATEKQLESLEKEYKEFGNVGTSATKEVAEKLQGIGTNIKQVGEKVKDVGTTLSTKVTAPIVAVGTASMAAFNKVDSALDIVTKKTGATGKALEDLHNTVREIGRTSPFDFEAIGTAVGEVYTRFGVTGEKLEDLSRQFLKFAKVNSVDVNESINSVQKAMDAFGLSADEAGAFLDTLNKVGQDTGVNVLNLASSLVTNATALQDMGMNAADAAALLGELEKSGTDASTVMTGFSKIQQKSMKEGISMQDAFRKALSSSQSAIDYFGAKAGPKLYNAFKNGTLSADMFRGGVHSLNDALGNLDTTYNNTLSIQDGIAESLNNLSDTGYELGKNIGEILAPVLKELNEILKTFNEWFRSLDDDTKQMIVKCFAIVAAVGPVLVVLGSVISAIGSIVSGIGGLIKLGGSVVGFFTSTSVAAEGTAAVTAGVTTATAEFGAALLGIAIPAAAAVAAFAGITAAVWSVQKHWGELSQTFNVVGGLFKAQVNLFVADCNLLAVKGRIAFTNFANSAKEKVNEGITAAKTTIQNGLGAAQSAINTFGNSARNTMQSTWSNITSRISGAMTSIRTGISSGFASAQSAVNNAMGQMQSIINSAIGSMKKTFNDFSSSSNNPLAKLKDNVTSTFSSNSGGIVGIIKSALDDIAYKFSQTNWKIGAVTIPTFSWSGTNNSEKGTTASLTVKSKTVTSYASAMSSGAILDRPTIFGALDGNLLRAGEAGKEVVIGANSLSSMIRQSATNTALNADVANILGLLAQYLPETANQNVVLDSGKLVGALSPALNRQFGMMIRG